MRPVKLIISAFGPYGGVETIDFREATDAGLFGIYGPTGSGKSSIFSAIAFALFGEGAKEEQGIGTMRSDFAPEALLTEVSLQFELGEKRYFVRRIPDQARPKSRGEGQTMQAHAAWLFDVSDIVYLACTSGSIGKTVDMMGVSPWEHGPKAYQAGIYMTMLSPCGNADSLTIPGTPLRVMDSMGVNSWGPGFPMDSEGVWDTDGMVCSGKKLRTDWLTEEIDCGGYKIPICDETELKTLYYTEPDVVFWTKPA